MPDIYDAQEIPGVPGRWRVVRYDDATRRVLQDLCLCPDGHESAEAARQCSVAAAALRLVFPPITQCPYCKGTGIYVPRGDVHDHSRA